MLSTFSLVIFFLAILLIFSQEVTRFMKKLAAKPGMKLLLPLVLASWFIETWEEWGRWLLLWCQAEFQQISHTAAQLLPFQTGALHLIRILTLFVFACIPAAIFWVRVKYKRLYSLPLFSYYISLLLWIIAVFLLIVQPV